METKQADMNGRVIASQFRISKLLGQGGMGSVYLAEQIEMGRQVVVKVMNPAQMGSQDLEERFRREAKAVAQLNHPNIVQVHVFGRTDDGQLYLAMEYVPGHTLTQLLEPRAPLAEARALRILDQMCSALIEAHALGLIHRDLKPDNVMLTDRHGTPDYVKILDFGIAKMLDSADAKLTRTGAIFGTPQYMAPEQATSRPVDQRTDIYALGLILYEMLSGQMPFSAPTAIEFLMKHVTEPVQPPTRKVSGLVILPRTEAIVMKCLAKEPEQRFQSVSELQREVRMALRDRPDAAKPFPTPEEPGQAVVVPKTAVIDAVAAVAPANPARVHSTGPAAQSSPPVAPPATKTKLGLVVAGLALVAVIAVAVVVGVSRRSAPAVGATAARTGMATGATDDTTASQDDPGSSDEASIEGVPVPPGTELMSSMPQALSLRTTMEPAGVLAFYRRAGRAWGAFKEIPNGLQFEDSKSPMTYLTISRMAGGTMISFVRNALVAPPKSDKARRFLGVLMPAEAQATVETPTEGVFQTPGPVEKVVAFFRKQLAGKPGVTSTETEVNGSPYLVVSVENGKLPFGHLAVMKTPDSLRPANGDWVQISIGK